MPNIDNLGYLTRFGRDTVESDAFNGVNSKDSLVMSSTFCVDSPLLLLLRDCIDLANWPLAGDATICCTPSWLTDTASRAAVSSSDSMDTGLVAFLRTSGSDERRIIWTDGGGRNWVVGRQWVRSCNIHWLIDWGRKRDSKREVWVYANNNSRCGIL